MGFKMWIMPGFGSNYTSCKIKQNKKGWEWFELKGRISFIYERKFIFIGRTQYQKYVGACNVWWYEKTVILNEYDTEEWGVLMGNLIYYYV